MIQPGFCHCGCGGRTKIADRSDRNVKKGQYRRYLPNHHRRKSPVEYVVDDNGCWVWQRSTNGHYGKAWVDGRIVLAHRHYYTIHKGEIPDGLQIDHLCRNPLCVNPAHLEAVTHKENLRRGIGRWRNRAPCELL